MWKCSLTTMQQKTRSFTFFSLVWIFLNGQEMYPNLNTWQMFREKTFYEILYNLKSFLFYFSFLSRTNLVSSRCSHQLLPFSKHFLYIFPFNHFSSLCHFSRDIFKTKVKRVKTLFMTRRHMYRDENVKWNVWSKWWVSSNVTKQIYVEKHRPLLVAAISPREAQQLVSFMFVVLVFLSFSVNKVSLQKS